VHYHNQNNNKYSGEHIISSEHPYLLLDRYPGFEIHHFVGFL